MLCLMGYIIENNHLPYEREILSVHRADSIHSFANNAFWGLDRTNRQDYTARAQQEQVNHMETKSTDHSHKQSALPAGWRLFGVL